MNVPDLISAVDVDGKVPVGWVEPSFTYGFAQFTFGINDGL